MEGEHRLLSAVIGGGFWCFWYLAFDATQLLKPGEHFWTSFILLGVVIAAICAWQGISFTSHMLVETGLYMLLGLIVILTMHLFQPFAEMLPAPELVVQRGLFEEPPALPLPIYYISLCYLFAFPAAMVMFIFRPHGVIDIFRSIVKSLTGSSP